MSIETVSSLKSILSNNSASSWTKPTKMIGNDSFSSNGTLSFNIDNEKPSFTQILAKSLGDVNGLQQEANLAIEKLATGKSKNIHETMLAVEQAELAFKSMNQIRLKVLDAYKQIMNMQV